MQRSSRVTFHGSTYLSRSLHTTRRHLQELERADFARADEQRQRVNRARQILATKRTVKAHARLRLVPCARPDTPVDTTSVPVEVRDQRAFVHYPASAEDVRAVLRLLPPGALDGLSHVILCLGAERQREVAEGEAGYGEPDPLAGRLGFDSLPGVYQGLELGTYFADDASIWLYASVYDAAAMPDRDLRELYLRLRMLQTLMHEVAHHKENLGCDPRGRWVDGPEGKNEWTARQWAYTWTLRYCIPYLEQRYPAEAHALIEWVGQHGGVTLPLSSLINHPDECDLYTSGAVESLFASYDEGASLYETRLGFAHDLHFAERFGEALRGLETILADHPNDCAARTLQADIYAHLERYKEAERVARAVVATEPTYARAWDVLVHVYRAQGRWPELEAAATQRVALRRAEGVKPVSELCERACARIESGDIAGATADLEDLGQIAGRRTRAEAVASLRALLLLRTEHYEEALGLARERLQQWRRRHDGGLPWCGVLLAVRYEAAQRLGRPQEAGTLSTRAVKLLCRHGHKQWVERLVADCGLRVWSKNHV